VPPIARPIPPVCLSVCLSGAASHVPVSGGHPGAIQAKLRKRRISWSSGLPGVGTECGSMAGLSHEIRGPHHRRSCLPSLAARPEEDRLGYKIAVLTHKVLHGSAPRYLGPLVSVADLPGRRTLRSGGTNRLMVPSVRRSAVGDRAFTVAGPRVWNTLLNEITTSQTLSTFRQQLKTSCMALQKVISGHHHLNQHFLPRNAL